MSKPTYSESNLKYPVVVLVAKSGSGRVGAENATQQPKTQRQIFSPFWRAANSGGDGTRAETRQVPSPLQPVQITEICFNFSDPKKLSYPCLRSK
jgi:hypothetical protein